MDQRGIRVFRVRAGLATGLIRAPIRDKQGGPARQRWTPPWNDERDRWDDPTKFVLVGAEIVAKIYRAVKLGLPFTGGSLLKASEGLMLFDQAINEANNVAMSPPGGSDGN